MESGTGTPTKGRDDAANWAIPDRELRVGEMPIGAVNRNVAGRRLVGPVQGFGQLWQKTYRVRLGGALAPADVITEWKANYATYWPKGNRFYAPVAGLRLGDVALINAASLGVQVSTGVRMVYADDESFTFMNAAGHPAAGMITFSAEQDSSGSLHAQVQVLIRANDPFYDVMLPIYGQRAEDAIWTKTLRALAAHFGSTGEVTIERTLVDRRRNWSEAKNIWQNAAIRSGLYMFAAPIRWVRQTARAR